MSDQNTLTDPGSDPAHEWQRPEPVVTPESLRAHADWIDGCGHGLEPGAALRAEAERQETAEQAEAANEAYVETLARLMSFEHFRGFDPVVGEYKWFSSGADYEGWMSAARAVLERLRADGRLVDAPATVAQHENVAPDQQDEWQKWQDVPDGVAFWSRDLRESNSWWWIKRDGELRRADGFGESKHLGPTNFMDCFAPFVRVNGNQQ